MSILIDVINEDVKPVSGEVGKWASFEVYAWNRDQDKWVFWSQHHDESDADKEAGKLMRAPNVHGVRVEKG